MRGRCLSLYLRPPFVITGEAKTTIHLPSGTKAGFFFNTIIKINRVAQ
jgi:hypothetical protein